MHTSPPQVEIVEVSPRDGLQNESVLLNTEQKLELIERAAAAGVRRIEATSFVHPRLVPQMADAEAVMAGLARDESISYSGLVLNQRGYQRAIEAGVDEVNFVVVVSDTFNQRNQGVSTAESIAAWYEIARAARKDGVRSAVTLAATFGCPFEGEVSAERFAEVAGRVLEEEPDEVSLADTIGVGVPTQVHQRVEAIRAISDSVRLRCHLHNTRNTGLANAVAAVEAGVNVLDASIGGIGGCPFAPAATGNIPTEDLVYLMERMGISTGLELDALSSTAIWIGEILGQQVPGLLSRAGGFPPTPGHDHIQTTET